MPPTMALPMICSTWMRLGGRGQRRRWHVRRRQRSQQQTSSRRGRKGLRLTRRRCRSAAVARPSPGRGRARPRRCRSRCSRARQHRGRARRAGRQPAHALGDLRAAARQEAVAAELERDRRPAPRAPWPAPRRRYGGGGPNERSKRNIALVGRTPWMRSIRPTRDRLVDPRPAEVGSVTRAPGWSRSGSKTEGRQKRPERPSMKMPLWNSSGMPSAAATAKTGCTASSYGYQPDGTIFAPRRPSVSMAWRRSSAAPRISAG